jgi:hypothetical protein
MTRQTISPQLAKTLLVIGTIQKRRKVTAQGRVASSLPTNKSGCHQNPVVFLFSLSLLLFVAILTTVRIFRIDSRRCTRGIASIHPLQPEMDAI